MNHISKVITFPLEGMNNRKSAEPVIQALSGLSGISELGVCVVDHEVSLVYDPEMLYIDEIIQTIQAIGYNVPQGEITLFVDGMKCITCVFRVEEALRDLDGVCHVSVNLRQGTTDIKYIPILVSPGDMLEIIQKIGYQAGFLN